MSVSIRSVAIRSMNNVGKDLRKSATATATGKNPVSRMSPTELVQSSVLSRTVSALKGATNNISLTAGKTDVMLASLSSQLDLIRSAYDLAVAVTTDTTLTATDMAAISAQYVLMMTTELDAIADGAVDLEGAALIPAAAAIEAVTGITPAANHMDLDVLDTHTAVLFAAVAANVSAGVHGDLTSVANATTAKTVLALAESIVSGHIATVSRYRELISNKADSLGDTIDDMASQLSDIRDADPIVQAQHINDAEQRTMMLGSLLAADSRTRQVITDAARQVLAL